MIIDHRAIAEYVVLVVCGNGLNVDHDTTVVIDLL